jgi:hypothetical protein
MFWREKWENERICETLSNLPVTLISLSDTADEANF